MITDQAIVDDVSESELTLRKEVACVAVCEPEPPREARILRSGTDVDALCWIEPMPLHEKNASPGSGFRHQQVGGPGAWFS